MMSLNTFQEELFVCFIYKFNLPKMLYFIYIKTLNHISINNNYNNNNNK